MKSSYKLIFFLISLIALTLALAVPNELQKLLFKAPQIDTYGHIIGFFILAWFLGEIIKLPLTNITICLFLYAALSEYGQYYLGYRNGEVGDFFADITGVLLFMVIRWGISVYNNQKVKF